MLKQYLALQQDRLLQMGQRQQQLSQQHPAGTAAPAVADGTPRVIGSST